MQRRVCILFFGGPDDQKALEIGFRMVENPAISLTLIRFKDSSSNFLKEESDDAAVEEFRRNCIKSMEYIEKDMNNVREEVIKIGQSGAFDLLVVGKGASAAKMVETQAENPELGLIGDILASSENGIIGSVLVIRQNNPQNSNKTTRSKIAGDEESTVTNVSVC
ncbi:hypothetical protein JCGZ_09046 [Jatropha curcas]|uniref:Cation/H(+) antiporter C-terminal domain-containing protein n=2 Tax=Jatropha curcas TaxID=180498 RepID=A0A067KKS8_JATCU|nr:hypothetical protein JCGZ_09046 [Jatropha curcas]